ncbi:MAG: MerR family transcriptional regulator [Deltaproteobacteria bacterium]|nr:MerR family transcriptional regulator [Deltaproteobacteria bacterium]
MSDTPQTPDDATAYSVGELADLGGVSRRTVRYYVQRGLLPAPEGLGRGAHYTAEHLARLVRIRELQEGGVALDDIARHLDHPPTAVPTAKVTAGFANVTPLETPPAPIPAPPVADVWRRLTLADGVEIHVRAGALDERHLRAVLDAARAALPPDGASEPARRGAATTEPERATTTATPEREGDDR